MFPIFAVWMIPCLVRYLILSHGYHSPGIPKELRYGRVLDVNFQVGSAVFEALDYQQTMAQCRIIGVAGSLKNKGSGAGEVDSEIEKKSSSFG